MTWSDGMKGEKAFVNAKMAIFMEGKTDPDGMDIKCPICGAEPGIWCAVVIDIKANRIGYLHEDRLTHSPMEERK